MIERAVDSPINSSILNPGETRERGRAEVDALPIRDEERPLFLRENACRSYDFEFDVV